MTYTLKDLKQEFVKIGNRDRAILDCDLWLRDDIIEHWEIVERLKKLLDGQTDDFNFTGKFLRIKVLGEDLN